MDKAWLILFVVVVIIHLIACFTENSSLRKLTKPILMPVLIGVYGSITKDCNMFIIVGLLLGFVGDIFLLWDDKPNFFYGGLLSFLVGHVLYIVAIIPKITRIEGIKIILLGVVYSFVYYFIFGSIKKSLGEIRIPAFIYGIVLLILNLLAVYNFWCYPSRQNCILLMGTLMFCISDYTLARNVFVKPMRYGHYFIMSTYIAAQFLIALGMAVVA